MDIKSSKDYVMTLMHFLLSNFEYSFCFMQIYFLICETHGQD